MGECRKDGGRARSENGKVEAYRTKVKLSFKYEGKD